MRHTPRIAPKALFQELLRLVNQPVSADDDEIAEAVSALAEYRLTRFDSS